MCWGVTLTCLPVDDGELVVIEESVAFFHGVLLFHVSLELGEVIADPVEVMVVEARLFEATFELLDELEVAGGIGWGMAYSNFCLWISK